MRTMQKIPLVAVLVVTGLSAAPTIWAAEPDDTVAVAKKAALDCTLYTKPYKSNEHGAFTLPAGLKWRVMPRYKGRAENGKPIVDDRLTLVLQDPKNRFWPVIAKMSIEQAEALNRDLEAMIKQKRQNTTLE